MKKQDYEIEEVNMFENNGAFFDTDENGEVYSSVSEEEVAKQDAYLKLQEEAVRELREKEEAEKREKYNELSKRMLGGNKKTIQDLKKPASKKQLPTIIMILDNEERTISIKVKESSRETYKEDRSISYEIYNSMKYTQGVRFESATQAIVVPMIHNEELNEFFVNYQKRKGKSLSEMYNVYKETVEKRNLEEDELEDVSEFINSSLSDEEKTALEKERNQALLNEAKKVKRKREKKELGDEVTAFEDGSEESENLVAWYYRIRGDKFIVDERTGNVCFMHDNLKIYKSMTQDQIKVDVSKLMDEKYEETGNQAFKNKNTNYYHEQVSKTTLTHAKVRTMKMGVSSGMLQLSDEYWAFYVQNGSEKLAVHAKVEKNQATGKYCFMLYEAKFENMCQKYVDTISLPLNNIIDENGNQVKKMDFKKESRYIYDVKYDEKSELNKWVLEEMFPTNNFKRLYRNYIGSMFLADEYQKILVVYGDGRDGKSMVIGMLARLMPEQFIDTAVDFTSGDKFSMADIQQYHFLSQSELQSSGFDEKLIKRISGGDTYSVRGLYQSATKVRSGKVNIVLHGNGSDTFTFSDTGTSTIERYLFTKVKRIEDRKQTARIPSLANYLILGGVLDDKQVADHEIEFKGGALIDLLHFFMEGALEHKNLRTPVLSDYGDEVVAYQRECFGKMMTRVGFMTDYRVLKSEGSGVLLEDYYNEFLKATNKQAKQYSKKLFENDISKGFREAYGVDYKREHVRIEEYNDEGQVVVRKHIALGLTVDGLPLKTYNFNTLNKMSIARIAKETMIEGFVEELSESAAKLTNTKETAQAMRELFVKQLRERGNVEKERIGLLADKLVSKISFKLNQKEQNTTAVRDMMRGIMMKVVEDKELMDRMEKISPACNDYEIEDVTDSFMC